MNSLAKKSYKRKTLTLFNLSNPYVRVEVRNSKTGKDIISSDACINYYFRRKLHTPPPTSCTCPSCKRKMFLKRSNQDIEDDRTMVGAHVELVLCPYIKYILPLCKSCNSKKSALHPFWVNNDLLCPLPRKE